MPILKIRDENGNWADIPALVGPPGPKGDSGDGNGDMTRETYDANQNGIVDDAEKLGGKAPEYYAAASDVPSKTSQLENDSGFLTGYTESDPTVPAWAKAAQKPAYTVGEISGLPEALAAKANIVRRYTATFLVAGWTGDAAPYRQTVTVAGLVEADTPIIDLLLSDGDTADSADAKLTAYGLVGRMVAGNGILTAYCYGDAPEAEFTVKLVVI